MHSSVYKYIPLAPPTRQSTNRHHIRQIRLPTPLPKSLHFEPTNEQSNEHTTWDSSRRLSLWQAHSFFPSSRKSHLPSGVTSLTSIVWTRVRSTTTAGGLTTMRLRGANDTTSSDAIRPISRPPTPLQMNPGDAPPIGVASFCDECIVTG